MHVVIVEERAGPLRTACDLFRSAGCHVTGYRDPARALEEVDPRVGLVVVAGDRTSSERLDLAWKMAVQVGRTPPRVLLMSDAGRTEGLEACPPSVVLGELPEPPDLHVLSRILDLLEPTRHDCPGTLAPLCPRVAEDGHCCHSPAYGACPEFDLLCGPRLRRWIARGAREGGGQRTSVTWKDPPS